MPDGKKILLDTNFLLIPGELGIDIFTEIQRICLSSNQKNQFFVLDKTIDELQKIIKEQKNKHKMAAQLALKLISAKNIQIIPTNTHEYVDKILIQLKDDYIIATQDKDLKSQLKHIIVLRQKKYLDVVEN